MSELAAEPEFDFVILADRAEAVNGKLYMMGGAWDGIYLRSMTDPASFSIAVGIAVPWHATNVEHLLRLRLEDADGKELTVFQVGFTTGRPASIPHGARQRVTLALPVAVVFPRAGTYVVACSLGSHEKRIAFHVQVAPPAPSTTIPSP